MDSSGLSEWMRIIESDGELAEFYFMLADNDDYYSIYNIGSNFNRTQLKKDCEKYEDKAHECNFQEVKILTL